MVVQLNEEKAGSGISAEDFAKLSPEQKGYAVYMQGAWNPNVPDKCPYKRGTKEYRDFHDGQEVAAIAVLDCYDD